LVTQEQQKSNSDQVSGQREATGTPSANRNRVSFSTQVEIKLKDRTERSYVHRYYLKKEMKKTDLEFNVTQVKGMASIKRYFHRLFPRAESSFFYCNVILASDKRPEELMDMISLRLRDNRM